MKGGAARAKLGQRDPRLLQSGCVDDVDPTSPIHEDVAQPETTDQWIQYQDVSTRVRDILRVIRTIKSDRLLRPIQPLWNSRDNRIHFAGTDLVGRLRLVSLEDHQGSNLLWIGWTGCASPRAVYLSWINSGGAFRPYTLV